MEPITVNKLLSISNDLFLYQENGIVSNNNFEIVVERNYKSKNLDRRVRDVSGIFSNFNFIRKDIGYYNLSSNFFDFINAWNENNLLTMNNCLASYDLYRRFLEVMTEEKQINIPAKNNLNEKKVFTEIFKKKYGINFVIFDTFRYWSLAFGQSYKSPFDDFLIWGGNWSDEEPTLEYFQSVLSEQFKNLKLDSSYVNAGIIADKTCRILNISFQAFEKKLNQFLDLHKGKFVFASITTRYVSKKKSEIITIKSRENVIGENYRNEVIENEWLEHRDLIDGVKINGKLMRLMRIN